MNYLVSSEDLPNFDALSPGIRGKILNGVDHGLSSISLIFNETKPSSGAIRHRHTYDEIFLVQEGVCAFTIDEEVVQASAGAVVLIPANLPHSFLNVGADTMRLVAIHASPSVVIERLDGSEPD